MPWCDTWGAVTTDDPSEPLAGDPAGGKAFVKRWADAPEGFYRAEASGLRWLAETGTVPVPEVLAVGRTFISLKRIAPGRPTRHGAEALGRALAALHAHGAAGFGAPWAGFIGPLPMDNRPVLGGGWADFYAERRLRPFLRRSVDAGALAPEDGRRLERVLERVAELAGPSADEPPRRLHGDLWAGNVVWDPSGTAWLVDPAAHGGHRETDLAMLALFGAPGLDRLLDAYHEAFPLTEGWRERVWLHQLHPLLVHAVLFGGGYGHRAAEAARRAGLH